MKKKIISVCLTVLLITILLQTVIFAYATQSDIIQYELRQEKIEFKLSDGTIYYTNTISYPYFLGNTAAETKINDKYASIIEQYRNNTTDFDALYQEELEWNPDGVNGLPFYDDIIAEVTYCNNGIISIKECSIMWSGGMHPYSSYAGYTYSINDGRELFLNDILLGSEKEIKNLIEHYNQDAVKYYKADAIMDSPFTLTSDGLCFLYNTGDAVPYEEIVIPFTEADAFTIFSESEPEDDINKTNHEDTGIIVYSDYTNLCIRKGSTITLSAGILAAGKLTEDISGITFQIEDTSVLSVSDTDIKDNCRYVNLIGLTEGTTNVVFNDSNTGDTAKIPITVYDDNYLSYTLNSVPTQNIEKYLTNVYNFNGVYIDSYEYTVNNDQSATVSFDVYNTNYIYGVVEVFDENGNMKDAVLVEKMASSNTSIKEAVWDNIRYLVRDIIDGDLLSYRQESGYTKKTSISVNIPPNGYIKICIDPENSLIVGLVNSVDGLMSMASLAGDIKDFDVNSKEFAKKLTTKLLTEEVYAEFIKDGNDAPKKLWKNVGKETFLTSKSMGDYTDTITKNINELKLGSIIAKTAADFGWNVGENVFKYFSGSAGTALNIMLTIGKIENLIIQQNDLIQAAGAGSIYIQNQGGGLRSCQQIKVESEDEFSPDTSLNVFSVSLDSTVLDMIKKINPDIYDAMAKGITYTYNISLLKNGDEVQSSGNVTVYIPIPKDLKTLAYASEFVGNITGKIIKIYRVEEDGNLTEMNVKIENGCFVFTTDHFSLYTIVGDDLSEDHHKKQDENYFSLISIIGISALIIVCVIAIVIIKRKKK